MIRRLFATDDDSATAILRLVLGLVFFAHGAQKMLGWLGGFGFSGTMGYFTFLMIRGGGAFSADHAIATASPAPTARPGLARS